MKLPQAAGHDLLRPLPVLVVAVQEGVDGGHHLLHGVLAEP